MKRAAAVTVLLSMVACSLGGPAAPASKRSGAAKVALGDVRWHVVYPAGVATASLVWPIPSLATRS